MQAVIGNIFTLHLCHFSFLSKQTRIRNTICVVMSHVLQYSDICVIMGLCDRVQQLLYRNQTEKNQFPLCSVEKITSGQLAMNDVCGT